jgi:hypothetical protein
MRLLKENVPDELKFLPLPSDSTARALRREIIKDTDPYRPYDDLPDTPRNRLLSFIAKFSPEYLLYNLGKITLPAKKKEFPASILLDDRSLAKWERGDAANTLKQARAYDVIVTDPPYFDEMAYHGVVHGPGLSGGGVQEPERPGACFGTPAPRQEQRCGCGNGGLKERASGGGWHGHLRSVPTDGKRHRPPPSSRLAPPLLYHRAAGPVGRGRRRKPLLARSG